ncbi:hypothetical protein NEHOM01_1657 [Nematocida homosporus]|uniref:uncharacterized protein n=1 Tax=Nematocida homosporus TaxID=1912981 RepID=UPI00221FB516|nr:uncharacterized protein NEHOM01_1657 [Nematocida homosporus]KAI5186718.1 hypothetical protein NEHOM01_1657 [Nematocida homosporus]
MTDQPMCIEYSNYTLEDASGSTIFKNITLSIPSNKVTAILGLAGNPKLKLIETLAGYCRPSYKSFGHIFVAQKGKMVDRDVQDWFQKTQYIRELHPPRSNTTAYELLLAAAKGHEKSPKDVETLLTMFMLRHIKKVPLRKLANLDQIKTAAVMGILAGKEITIWEDFFTGLSPTALAFILSSIKHTSKTVVISLQNPKTEVVDIIDHVVVVHRQTVVYSGPVEEIVPFFAQHGIPFPKDISPIRYLYQLYVPKNRTPETTKAITAFNQLAQRISQQDRAKPSPIHQTKLPLFQPVSFKKIATIFKHSFSFNPFFKGSSILIELVLYATIFLLLFFYLRNQAPIGRLRGLVCNEPAIIRALQTHQIDPPADLKALLKQYPNFKWLDCYSVYLVVFTTTVLLVALIMPINMANLDFYLHCKRAIEEKQFVALEYILALLTEIVLRKVVLPFLAFGFLYRLSNSQLTYLAKVDPSHSFGVSLLFVFTVISLLIGTYSLLFFLLPLSFFLLPIIKVVFCCLFCIIPYKLFIAKGPLSLPTINLYTNTLGPTCHQSFNDALSYKGVFETITIKVLWVLKWIFKCQPTMLPTELISKISLFRNYTPVYNPYHLFLIEKLVILLIAARSKADRAVCRDRLQKYLQNPAIHMQAYELLTNTPITKATFLTIIKTFLLFFGPPCLVVGLLFPYFHRYITPKLR